MVVARTTTTTTLADAMVRVVSLDRVTSQPGPSSVSQPVTPLSHFLASGTSMSGIVCPTDRTWWVTAALASRRRSARRAPSPGDLRLSLSPSMINMGMQFGRDGGSLANGESNRNRMAPARSVGRVSSRAPT